MDSPSDRPKIRSRQALRKELSHFLYEAKRWSQSDDESRRRTGAESLRSALQTFRKQPWDSYIFGGLLRDLAYYGAYSAFPRDLDIVVNDESIDAIADAFGKSEEDRNRFGGLALDFDGWKVDIWALEETWAFKQQPSFFKGAKAIEALPKTTFLNVEAIAVELNPSPGQARKIYEHNFFDALQQQTLDINFELNPYPDFCLLRTFLTAFELRFALSFPLLQYIWDHVQDDDIDSLVDRLVALQSENYGTVRLSREWLRKSIREIGNHLGTGKEVPLHLSTLPLTSSPHEPVLFESSQSSVERHTAGPPY